MMGQQKSQFIYQKIAQQLIKQIEQGTYKPGEKLPSENKLASNYGVHRLTIRQAIASLIEKNLVYRLQGSGTFVKEQKLDYSLNFKTNFTESLFDLGYLPCLKIISSQVIPASPEIAQCLNISINDSIFRLKLLRTATAMVKKQSQNMSDLQPLCLSISYLIADKFPDLSVLIYQTNSLYTLLQNHYHIQPHRTKTQIETELASREYGKLLKINPGIPLLITKSFVCDQNNHLFEYTISHFRGDIFSLEITF
ncbi:MAG: GntR family transcriptional regulator [Cyanobacteria bacterium P01_G01_bin.49]